MTTFWSSFQDISQLSGPPLVTLLSIAVLLDLLVTSHDLAQDLFLCRPPPATSRKVQKRQLRGLRLPEAQFLCLLTLRRRPRLSAQLSSPLNGELPCIAFGNETAQAGVPPSLSATLPAGGALLFWTTCLAVARSATASKLLDSERGRICSTLFAVCSCLLSSRGKSPALHFQFSSAAAQHLADTLCIVLLIYFQFSAITLACKQKPKRFIPNISEPSETFVTHLESQAAPQNWPKRHSSLK